MSADTLFGPVVEPEQEPRRLTERDVLDRLRVRYSKKAGNGERYVLAEHVRDHGAFVVKQAPRLYPQRMPDKMRVSLERSIAKTARRHMTIDAEAGRPLLCDRYVPPYTCLTRDHEPCWACRANAAFRTTTEQPDDTHDTQEDR